MHPALVKLMSALEQDSNVGATVLAKMAAVEQTNPGDSKALRDVLELLGAEWAVDYADQQGPYGKLKNKLNVPHTGSAVNDPVMVAGSFNTPCFEYREKGACSMTDCPHIHEGRTGVQCTDPEFEQTGLCSHFKKCLAEHKFDEVKFGTLKDAMAKFPVTSSERMALKYVQTK
jgi:hypothetical protein